MNEDNNCDDIREQQKKILTKLFFKYIHELTPPIAKNNLI